MGEKRQKTYKDLLLHFSFVALTRKRGRLLLYSWAAGMGGTFLIGLLKLIQKRASKAEALAEVQVGDKKKKRVKVGKLREKLLPLLKIIFPRLVTKTSVWLTVYTVFLFIRILLTIKIAKLTGLLGKMVAARAWTEMFSNQLTFSLICIPAAVVNAMMAYSKNQLSLTVRESMLRYVHEKYLSKLVYYRASNVGEKMDDLDQRATADLKKFSSTLTEQYGNLLKPFLEVVLLSHSLGKLMGLRHLGGFFGFFIFASQWLRFIMPPFASLTAETAKREGNFRLHHSRLIQHAEEIAFYGGSEREQEIIDDSLTAVGRISRKHFLLQLLMGAFDSYMVKYGASMVAYSMLIPSVYLGKKGLNNKSPEDIMQYYLTCTTLFVALGTACKHLVLNYKSIQSLTGLTSRVSELRELLEQKHSNSDEIRMKEMAVKLLGDEMTAPKMVEGEEIEFLDVDLVSPGGHLLAKKLNFKVPKNENVLISGPNGCGKTSLFRVLGGLWPLVSGTLVKPSMELFYVPQRPYMCPGTLRDQVTYPHHVTDVSQDEELDGLMSIVGLTSVIKREGGWSIERENWMEILSGGEKQRVAMARLFYHKPAFGILDECTSAVSADIEGQIYEACHKFGITIFTVSHRPQLIHHHNFMLKFTGDGSWEWIDLRKQQLNE